MMGNKEWRVDGEEARNEEAAGQKKREREIEGEGKRSLLFKGVDAPHLNVTHKPCVYFRVV